ncbi:hypothetical protein Trydic_g21548 [Trypoxylus dichotomus]
MVLCKICNVHDDSGHKSSDRHRFNFLLFEWNYYRKKIAKDKDGIEISFEINTPEIKSKSHTSNREAGTYNITISPKEFLSANNHLQFSFKVFNQRKKDNIFLMKASILSPLSGFSIEDERNTCVTGDVVELCAKCGYTYSIHFELSKPLIGSFKIPIGFTFQVCSESKWEARKTDEENKETKYEDMQMKVLSIAREIVVVVSDFEETPKEEEKSPFKFGIWEDIVVIIPPINKPHQTNRYPIPKEYQLILMSGLKSAPSQSDMPYLMHLRKIYVPDEKGNGNAYPTPENYSDFFHFLLWLDEIGQKLMLERYNMSNVTMIPRPDKILELEVPGLAEKRPSLVPGDLVKIRFHEDHTVYQAIVMRINDKTIDIRSMHPDLYNAISQNPALELDVAFEANRLHYERMHQAIDVCIRNSLMHILCPEEHRIYRRAGHHIRVSDDRFFNKSILNNPQQKAAVLNILNRTSSDAPYIVFGPPGTGKTLTIVEAILQIRQYRPKAKILVCAPANAACDMLAEKLIQFIKEKTEIIRIHTENRNWNDVPEQIKAYSNYDGTKYTKITATQLYSYNIVITTLVLIGKYSGKYSPDHVFIDEAAQALEPEADIAVSMLQPNRQLVLAGDPKQLGPICASAAAAKLKLEISLLERLMTTNPLYMHENNNYITMLKLNYRAHPDVLKVPNYLFYDDQLQAVNAVARDDPIAKTCIFPRTVPKYKLQGLACPVEFCSVISEERREGKSPSYYNELEMQMVMKYIKAMLSLSIKPKVSQTDIGVITPYVRQLHRIKNKLKALDLQNIEVGTTETFQGREKRIIIISTVRSRHDLLLVDEKYKLGFVKNEKRMNVALTRAMSKLVVIGNPHVLGNTYNPKNQEKGNQSWEYLIEFCEGRNAFFGAPYVRRTIEIRNDIINRLSVLHLKN